MLKKNKKKLWKNLLLLLIFAAAYLFFYKNGFNIAAEYPEKTGALVLSLFGKIAASLAGWDVTSLFGEEMNLKAGEAVLKAAHKGRKAIQIGGKKLRDWTKANLAAKDFQERTGKNKLVSIILTQENYARLKKNSPELLKGK